VLEESAVHHPADVAGRRDGDWATVGGIITQTKRIRTKKGDPMMFATLDDLEGTVELLVFGNVLSGAEDILAADRIVTVRGRVDHRDATSTCVINSVTANGSGTGDCAAGTTTAYNLPLNAAIFLVGDLMAARCSGGRSK